MRTTSLVFVCLLSMAMASIAFADTRTVILPAPGIITDENAAAARGAALTVKGVVSAEAFVQTHTIEVELIDGSVSIEAVVQAINAAGYTVGTPGQKKAGGK